MTCTGPAENSCLSCKVGKYLLNSTCVKECSDGTWKSSIKRSCEPCNKACTTCYGPSEQQYSFYFSNIINIYISLAVSHVVIHYLKLVLSVY